MENNKNIYFSICIPAYERTEYLKRLLNSIAIQTYKYYEIIISDDSKTDHNKLLIEKYKNLNIIYIKNNTPLGSPKNWNNAISYAKYEWIKIMHDDDHFHNEHALEEFSKAINRDGNFDFIFSSHIIQNENKKTNRICTINRLQIYLLKITRFILFQKNIIGHPSCVVYKKDPSVSFDNSFKWVVDIEFYFRYLNKHKSLHYINNPLIVISDNESQITKQVFRNIDIEIKENHIMLEKIGENALSNIIFFDYYWRLYRNLDIRDVTEIERFNVPFPLSLQKMLKFQLKIPLHILKIGPISKIIMTICYFYVWSLKRDA